jgi:hypothetical protein
LTPAGHRLTADIIARYLKDHELLTNVHSP